jgi:CheY-like chemotaxis protein
MPIVFVSGLEGSRFLAQAQQAGCDEYLVKPINLGQLEEIVKKYTYESGRAFGAI